jgi:glyoxylase-like metal-dependent hydrolase (beta-lactamase superfamily II)
MTKWNDGIAKITLPTPFPVGDVHVYAIKGDRLTLVDAGTNTKESNAALVKQLAELKLTPKDIEQIILTHHHPDHMGLLDIFSESVEIVGHPHNQRWLTLSEQFLEENAAFYQSTFKEFGVPQKLISYSIKKELDQVREFSCNRTLSSPLVEGDTPLGLDGWKVVETPGHASSHIGIFQEKEGVYIGGDLLLPHISPNPILEPPLLGKKDRPQPQLELNASLKKIAEYPIHCVYPGHGDKIDEVGAVIDARLGRQHDRAMLVKKWLEQENLSVFQICQRLFPRVYERELLLALSETVAQIDYLLSLEEINIMDNESLFIKAN